MQFRPVLSALSCATSRTVSLISASASASASPLSLHHYSKSLLTGAVNTRSTATATTTTKSQLPKIRFANTVGRMEKVDTTARLSQLRKLMDAKKVDVYSRSTAPHASHMPLTLLLYPFPTLLLARYVP